MSILDIPWQTLVEIAPDGVCVVDVKGGVQYANPAALALLGLTAPGGAPAAEWLADLGDANRDLLVETIEQGGQTQLHLRAGQYAYLLVETERLSTNAGTVVRVRRDYEVAAAETTGILIHDLRLPMTSIIGYARMLQTIGAESLDDMQRQFLDTIDRNVRRLDTDLQAAQEMTRIDRGKVNLTLTAQPSAAIAAEALEELRPLVEEKGHQVILDFPEDLPPVHADGERLKQVLHILLENALRYTSSNGQIGVRGHPIGDLVQIDVEDNGPGIPSIEQSKVFSRFFRGEDERIREYSGLGLSLYIARGLTRLQGGQLWFESTPDQGSVFSFTLPTSETS